MSNQTHREPVDPARKRREYLLRVLSFPIICFIGTTVAIISGMIVVMATALTMGSKPDPIGLSWDQSLPIIMPAVLAAGVGLVASFRFRKELRKTAYVPPIREQLAALAAEDVLLRSSDEPPATPKELLRAAQVRAEQPAEELLRAEQGGTT